MIRSPPKKLFQIFSLKKPQKVNFECFLGLNDPFGLFSHYILCPTRPMEEKKKLQYPPFKNSFFDSFSAALLTLQLLLKSTSTLQTSARGQKPILQAAKVFHSNNNQANTFSFQYYHDVAKTFSWIFFTQIFTTYH